MILLDVTVLPPRNGWSVFAITPIEYSGERQAAFPLKYTPCGKDDCGWSRANDPESHNWNPIYLEPYRKDRIIQLVEKVVLEFGCVCTVSMNSFGPYPSFPCYHLTLVGREESGQVHDFILRTIESL